MRPPAAVLPRQEIGEESRFERAGSPADEAMEQRRREDWFAELAGRHSRLMYRVAYGLLRNAQDAEDAVQEAFLKLYRGERWRQMDNPKAYLARTVWRVALDRLPKGAERAFEADEEFASGEATPEANAVRGEKFARLRRMIEALPEELRQVLVLSAIEELNSREIAEVMGIAEGTVRTRLMRARSELKRRFEGMQEGRR